MIWAIRDSPSRLSRPDPQPEASAAMIAVATTIRTVIISVCAALQVAVEADPQATQLQAVITRLAAAVPITSPAIPSGLYSATLTITSTTMFIAARRVGIHGRLSAKKVRLSSRLTPANGRLKANQNSAVETRWVERR